MMQQKSFSTPTASYVRSPTAAAAGAGHVISSPAQSLNETIRSPRSPSLRYEAEMHERAYLPDCWLDDKRMELLFAPFRVRATNPEGWDLKMNFWTNLVKRWCLHKRRVIFTIDDLRRALIRGDHYPHVDCLKLVISHMARQQAISFADDDETMNNGQQSNSIKTKSFNLAKSIGSLVAKPFTFGWSLIVGGERDLAESDNDFEDDDDDSCAEIERVLPKIAIETKLCNRETFDILTESVESYLRDPHPPSSKCIRYGKFLHKLNRDVFADHHIDSPTYDAIIRRLESSRRLRTLEEGSIRIVKLGEDAQISSADIALIRLEASREALESETCQLAAEMETMRAEAREALASGNRPKALLLLRRKKRLETVLRDKDTQIDNIETIYRQLLDADSQSGIMAAFRIANDVLRHRTESLERMQDTVADVEDTLSEIAQITADINRPISSGGSEAASEIELDAERELREMLLDIEHDDDNDEDQEKENLPKSKQEDDEEEDQLLQQLADLSVAQGNLSTTSSNEADEIRQILSSAAAATTTTTTSQSSSRKAPQLALP